jgi:hypothetical protein
MTDYKTVICWSYKMEIENLKGYQILKRAIFEQEQWQEIIKRAFICYLSAQSGAVSKSGRSGAAGRMRRSGRGSIKSLGTRWAVKRAPTLCAFHYHIITSKFIYFSESVDVCAPPPQTFLVFIANRPPVKSVL